MRKFLRINWLPHLIAIGVLLSGCAAGTTSKAPLASPTDRMESLLSQAGFKLFPESHPNCQKLCKTLPTAQLVPYKKGSQQLYGYVSLDGKRLYGGDEAAYQRFINLAVMQKIEEGQRKLADERTDPEFWSMWANMHGGG